ncbi:MAG: DNA-directed RNA polymerase subunit beta [Candidatus Tectomicrobia bacterium]|uniref:DNA-directed RNA polymerase subunit beta n=1 Tax=Tectimicrobiota bacterium TaxID=2528274 RepID=A0A932GS08_UNCTE|nr:DNA-directed RNA polymerase subunit beta [Candidatus Tectomicrobia bacterium]
MFEAKPTSQGSKYRERIDFARIPKIIEIPNLIDIQLRSYEWFLQYDRNPLQREDKGLEGVFRSVFPISDFNETSFLEYVGYEIGAWECDCGEYRGLGAPGVVCEKCHQEVLYRSKYDVDECRQRGMTYADPLRVLVRMVLGEKDSATGELRVKDIKEQKVYLGEIPLMTEKGTFIINGTERVIVSQLHRSPGAFFSHEKGKSHASGRGMYMARIIPYRGSWIDFELDAKEIIYVRIDRRRKIPATILLRAFGLNTEDLLDAFYEKERMSYQPTKGAFVKKVSDLLLRQRVRDDLVDSETGEVLVKAGRRISRGALKRLQQLKVDSIPILEEDLVGQFIARDVVDLNTGEVLLEINEQLTPEKVEIIKGKKIKEFHILFIDNYQYDTALRDTMAVDRVETPEEALIDIYKRLRPGDPPTLDTARNLFENLFFNPKRYDLSRIGRLKLNTKLGLDLPLDQRKLTAQDVVAVVKYLLGLRHGIGLVDDIDHLGNRRVRSVGELLENQFRIGLVRMERAIRERMSIQDLEGAMPHDLINSKPVSAAIKEFFGSSQLSQFMDQTNPLSEITHKRRLSALGPGGLTRERAGFEVRDVHPTHYGRICPIETPEGPNIGLIASLSTYARVNEFGFIEVPYRQVQKGKVTDEVDFLSAIEEDKYIIAQANAELDEKGYLAQDLISARKGGEFVMVPPDKVDYMDVSPKQLVSVAASLIPFLENDDANRALMGSNMQRQAVPLLRTEAPLVGTGMEYITACNSGAVVLAKAPGEVVSVDATRVVVRATSGGSGSGTEPRVDIYTLTKYQRSNQNTSINQKPIVREGNWVEAGDVIADGPATDKGELALGRNILVAFMPWGGYNYEDAIVISEKVVKEDIFTSIHIEEFEVEARDTKQGKEEITRDIPNVGEEALKNLDESGIIRMGAKVRPGDILVGKVTPKGETQLSPEEKLLKAIFGDKAGDVKDTSLTVPPGIEGTVIDVKVFSRKGVDKDLRTQSIEEEEIARVKKDFDDEIRIVEEERDKRIRNLLEGRTLREDFQRKKNSEVLIPKKKKITLSMVEKFGGKDLSVIASLIDSESVRDSVQEVEEGAKDQIHALETLMAEKIARLRKGDELPPGVIKMVKVYIAMKRKLSVGDKMAGRHGNKGVVSIIVPEEDMPFMEDGMPIELILNPLGVPSRMNVGQILETSLGWAARKLEEYYATPVFDGAKEFQIRELLQRAGLPESGETVLYDGKTGIPFDQKVVVGQIYMMKLHHLVDDKIHARSTGPYSLVTQQPLGGKAQFGGQRLGEMEVWALEAYGAARTLQEMLTVKSDDVQGRTRMYEAIVKGENTLEPSLPESFNVLIKEMQSLALDVELIENGHKEE